MFGRPMISAEIGTRISDINDHYSTGFVVEPQVPPKLECAMNILLADQAMPAKMGDAARERYERLLSGAVLGCVQAELVRELGC